jgi:predicted nucleotidyltransferase
MEDIQIVREFKYKVQHVYPDAEIYFYGSRARKTHHENSDYYVLVILEKINPQIDREYVKTKVFPKEISKLFHQALFLIQECDYSEFSLIT